MTNSPVETQYGGGMAARWRWAAAATGTVAMIAGLAVPAAAYTPPAHRRHAPRHASHSILETNKPVIVFLVPHQDDEILSFGAAIEHFRDIGYVVVLHLVTNGGQTGAKRLLAEKGYDLSEQQVIDARLKEFTESSRALGATFVRYSGVEDGTLTVSWAEEAIKSDLSLWPAATFITESSTDRHPDHRALGQALGRLVGQGKITAPAYWAVYPYNCPTTPYGAKLFLHPSGFDQAAITVATNAYDRWNPDEGRYAIGGEFSVPGLLERAKSGDRTWELVAVPRPQAHIRGLSVPR